MDIFFLIALAITSIVAVTFIVERGLALRWAKIVPPDVVYAIQNYRSENQLPQLRGACEHNPSTLSRLLLFATEHLDWPKTETVDVLETRARHEVTKLERGLVVLEIIVGIAPLLGLVGTIYGLITLFGHMDPGGMQEHSKFAQGISLALNATLFGLLIAIPALVAWSYYSKKVETLSVEMESLCDEFLRKHYRQDERPATTPIGASRQTAAERGVSLTSALPTPKPSAQS
jgi:biopolymer transport protein ExbB